MGTKPESVPFGAVMHNVKPDDWPQFVTADASGVVSATAAATASGLARKSL